MFLSIYTHSNAQPERFQVQRQAFNEKIDNKQKYLDALDGKYDNSVTFKDPILTRQATKAYLTLVDSIQTLLEEKNTDGEITYKYLLDLYYVVNNIEYKNYHLTNYYENLFINLIQILKHKEEHTLIEYLAKDYLSSLSNLNYFNEKKELTKDFLLKASEIYPNDVLKIVGKFYKESYAGEIIDKIVKVSPQSIKSFLISNEYVNKLIRQSTDSVTIQFLKLFDTYSNNSKVYYFLDMIYHNEISPDIINSISDNNRVYLNALIQANKKIHPLAEYDLTRELSIKALEEIRKVNDLHDLNDTSIRFAAVKGMSADDLYTLMVYSPEEIFTSTFNGLFERLLQKLKIEKVNGFELLKDLQFKRFRTFIKLCAGYNTLETFLKTMPEKDAEDVLKRFVTALYDENGDISEAVHVADTFGSIDNKEFLSLIENYLKEEYCKEGIDNETRTLYGLLLKLLYQKTQKAPDKELSLELQSYILPPIEQIPVATLTDSSGSTQMHFFFDDDDGVISFSTFINAFKNAGFQIADSNYYVIIKGKGQNPTTIYANKPEYEREGQAQLITLVQDGIIKPEIIVHRGHSYYAMITIEQIPEYAKVVFLGSCGGYHNISEVIKRAPNAHIIASKQIGTYNVNNALLVELSNTLRNQNELVWSSIWQTIDKKLKGSGKTYERFLDYIPPNKNMGAIFIQAYNMMTQH
ncbi:MAG: hypothetical protein M9887_03505 [Chitinophagales bacterium]|nr:hypothetical protein [Chitinophagales bacterium]